MAERKRTSDRRSASAKHKRFAEEYILDLNATKAAERAGYSPKTARQQGQRLLSHAAVEKMITELKAARRETTGDLAHRVIRELELIAFADIGDVFNVDADGKVTVRPLDQLTPEQRRAIAEITQVTTEKTAERYVGDDRYDGKTFTEKVRLSVKHHSKISALKMLVDHLGLNPPVKHEHDVAVTSAKERLAAKLAALSQKKP